MFQIVLGLFVVGMAPSQEESKFPGWQAIRVISQEGTPSRLLAADLRGEGRDQLIVVNTSMSRLDLYRWLPPDQRTEAVEADPDRPNELPLASDWNRSELPLDELPLDVVVQDLDNDQRPELVILTSPSNKVMIYKREATGDEEKWQKTATWNLLPGSPTGRSMLLLRSAGDGKFELLVSFEQGIQTLVLAPGSRPSWLSPREARGRLDWKLLDIDGDGDQDLVEWSSQARQTIRWFDCQNNKLLPAQVLFDQAVQGVEAITVAGQPAELLLLGGPQQGLLRRFTLARGEQQPLGQQHVLPMPGGTGAVWCGLVIDGQPALVAADPVQPRLRLHPLGPEGWQAEQTFPSLGNLRALVAPQASPGKLLLWVRDAADLYQSNWDSGRLSFPAPMPHSPDVKDRRILALERVGDITWWAQRVGGDVDLYVWRTGQAEAAQTRFPGLGANVDAVVWLGGEKLLVKDAFASVFKLVRLEEGNLSVSDPAHVSKAPLGEFRLYQSGGDLRPARLTDGVLQWLGNDLHPEDQVMLSEGQRLTSFVPLADGRAWVLEQSGAFLHLLEPDDAGVLRETQSVRVDSGQAVTHDPVLGLVLVDQDRVRRLSQGQPWELRLVDSLDSRVGRPSGVREATIHRFMTTEITGQAPDEVVLSDDVRHQLTVLSRTDDGLKPLLSWPVFEDQTYPYGGVEAGQVSEPRAVAGFNADGDAHRDVGFLCHDRLLIYLARENE